MSGEWSGVMGDVILGKFPFSLAPWLTNEERVRVLDLEGVVDWDRFVSCVVLDPPQIDPGLFIRPFTNLAWAVIFVTTGVYIFLLFIPSMIIKSSSALDSGGTGDARAPPEFRVWLKSNKQLSSESILELVIWLFFTIVYAYYGGALTMFFANEQRLPFETLTEALDFSPEWRVLLLNDGYGTVIFEHKAHRQLIPEYQKYLKKVKSSPESYMVDTHKDGLMSLKEDRILYSDLEHLIRSVYNKHSQELPQISLFDRERSARTLKLAFTKNSPLAPFFKKITQKSVQGGLRDALILEWFGPKIRPKAKSESYSLTIGQTFLVFAIMGVAIILSIIIYSFEVFYRNFNMFFKSKRIVVPENKHETLLSFDEWRHDYWNMTPAPLTQNRTVASAPPTPSRAVASGVSRVASAPTENQGHGGQIMEQQVKWKIYRYLSPRS